MEDPRHQGIGDPISEGEDDAAGPPLLVQHQHGEEAGRGVEAVEEVVLEGGEAPVVHGDAEAPGQRRDEDGDREGDVAEACRQALTKHHRS